MRISFEVLRKMLLIIVQQWDFEKAREAVMRKADGVGVRRGRRYGRLVE